MKKALLFAIPVILIVIMFSLSGGSSDEYLKELAAFREGREDFFKNSNGSPFVQKGLAYKPVSYFEGDPDYKINARLERITKRDILQISNSDGSAVNYLKFAKAHFKLNGKDHSLLILKALGFGNQYLTAFADETSGLSTYGGGRYLDLVIGKSDRVEIDFNKAYNPYCAYSPDFQCPFPPAENFLKTTIEAGEKDFK